MAKKEYKVLSYKEFIKGRKLAEPGKYGKKKDPKWAVGAAKEKKEEHVEEDKWDYPEYAKGSKGDSYLDPGNSLKKKWRKEFRKKQKAKAHRELKKGLKK